MMTVSQCFTKSQRYTNIGKTKIFISAVRFDVINEMTASLKITQDTQDFFYLENDLFKRFF